MAAHKHLAFAGLALLLVLSAAQESATTGQAADHNVQVPGAAAGHLIDPPADAPAEQPPGDDHNASAGGAEADGAEATDRVAAQAEDASTESQAEHGTESVPDPVANVPDHSSDQAHAGRESAPDPKSEEVTAQDTTEEHIAGGVDTASAEGHDHAETHSSDEETTEVGQDHVDHAGVGDEAHGETHTGEIEAMPEEQDSEVGVTEAHPESEQLEPGSSSEQSAVDDTSTAEETNSGDRDTSNAVEVTPQTSGADSETKVAGEAEEKAVEGSQSGSSQEEGEATEGSADEEPETQSQEKGLPKDNDGGAASEVEPGENAEVLQPVSATQPDPDRGPSDDVPETEPGSEHEAEVEQHKPEKEAIATLENPTTDTTKAVEDTAAKEDDGSARHGDESEQRAGQSLPESHLDRTPPTLVSVDSAEEKIHVYGSGFVNTPGLKCEVSSSAGTHPDNAEYVSDTEVICLLPSAASGEFRVRVTNDGLVYSNPALFDVLGKPRKGAKGSSFGNTLRFVAVGIGNIIIAAGIFLGCSRFIWPLLRRGDSLDSRANRRHSPFMRLGQKA